MTRDRFILRLFKPRIAWWFVAAIMLHVAAWCVWFTIAARHPVGDVPLATATPR